jgi:hypothetical protein
METKKDVDAFYLKSSTKCPFVVVAFHSFGDCIFIHIFAQQEVAENITVLITHRDDAR